MPFDNWLRKLEDVQLQELFDDLVAELHDRGIEPEDWYASDVDQDQAYVESGKKYGNQSVFEQAGITLPHSP